MSKRKVQPSTSLVVQQMPKPKPEVEKLPTPQDLVIPAALLLAAEAVSEHKDDKRPQLQGVHLQVEDGQGRIVGTDGSRMFVGSFKIRGVVPDWLAGEGVTLSNEGMKARVGMIAKLSDEDAQVRITYAIGWPKATLSDASRDVLFQTALQKGVYPDYSRVIGSHSFVRHDDEGRATGNEWEPVGINSVYLKHVGEVAKLLEAGLPKAGLSKEEKEIRKKGMIVRAFNNSGSQKLAPLVFDFSTWPGAILVIMPAKLMSPAISAETAVLLAPAIKMTVAALRAHATRNLAWADTAATEGEKAAFISKAEGFNARVAEILKRAPGLPALEAPKDQPEPESSESSESSEDKAEEAASEQDEPSDEAGDGEEEEQHDRVAA